ncbi:MAG TPA: efflux RND transporter periplasmic adaptor subunit [Ferruginibacter sp.]|nr:efflux RND transporter periplasmic adaptor subunit [Ferruginibacter sp.]
MSKKTKWILFGALGLIVVIVILKFTVFGKNDAIKVTAEKAQNRTIIEVVNASGKVYPTIEVKVSPDVSGEITDLPVQEGDTVKKGQVVAKIYADVYSIQRDEASAGVLQSQAQVANSQASIDAVKAQLDQAEKTYDMQKQLFDQQVISKNEFYTAEAAYKSAVANYNAAKQGIIGGQAAVKNAQSQLAKANTDLSRTIVVAPMDGVVSLLSVKKGERVVGSNMMAGTEMLRIADMSQIEVRVDVSESDIPKVKLGDSAIVSIDAYNNRKFKGIVTQISSSNNGASTQSDLTNTSTDVTNYKVYIRMLPESYSDLLGKGGPFPFRPGMSASADIQTKVHVNVLSVPINAVTTRDKNDSTEADKKPTDATVTDANSTPNADDLEVVVFVLDKDDKVKKVLVTTDIQDINYIEITGGLSAGDQVITAPYDTVSKLLKNGDKVKVVDKKDLYDNK